MSDQFNSQDPSLLRLRPVCGLGQYARVSTCAENDPKSHRSQTSGYSHTCAVISQHDVLQT